jgi:hypothetical protein
MDVCDQPAQPGQQSGSITATAPESMTTLYRAGSPRPQGLGGCGDCHHPAWKQAKSARTSRPASDEHACSPYGTRIEAGRRDCARRSA